jgi:hypothetical protein
MREFVAINTSRIGGVVEFSLVRAGLLLFVDALLRVFLDFV